MISVAARAEAVRAEAVWAEAARAEAARAEAAPAFPLLRATIQLFLELTSARHVRTQAHRDVPVLDVQLY